jgi:hypothetical protein
VFTPFSQAFTAFAMSFHAMRLVASGVVLTSLSAPGERDRPRSEQRGARQLDSTVAEQSNDFEDRSRRAAQRAPKVWSTAALGLRTSGLTHDH